MPIDSDFIVMEGAIEAILGAIGAESRYPLLFFPCVQYPAMRRLDTFTCRTEISYEYFVVHEVGEMVPVTSLDFLRERQLAYPNLRAGGESLLWWRILAIGPALFLDIPVILYRTDVSERICTLAYQMKHPAELAAIADAMVLLLSDDKAPAIAAAHVRRNLAAGTYHLLSGKTGAGRRRLASAARGGSWIAVAALVLSFGATVFSGRSSVFTGQPFARPIYESGKKQPEGSDAGL